MKLSRTVVLACAALTALTIGSISHRIEPKAYAQQATPRTVSGAVLDAADQPVIGATVFLRNMKTKSVRSFTSVEKGHYYFAQVNKVDDFELWAEKDGQKSAVKTVSAWDTRTQYVNDLKMK